MLWAGLCPLAAQTTREGAVGAEVVRAVMLFNFARFTEWTDSHDTANGPLVIGAAGDRALEEALFKLAERQTIQDRRVRVVRVSSLRSLQDCHVLYVGSPAMLAEVGAPSAAEFLHEVVEKPVLTVSDSPTFLAQGGILNVFVGEEGKLRVEISPRQAAKAGLVLSSRLLALARIVDVPAPMTTP
jgi:hypothetical protein